jgi:hypothetical protein
LFSLWSVVNYMHSFYSILDISSTLMPSFLSISYSTGKPWVSHPKRRSTLWPVEWAYRVTISYNAIKIWIVSYTFNANMYQEVVAFSTLMVPASKWP